MKTHKILLPFKANGWGWSQFFKTKNPVRLGDFTFSIEGEVPHPQHLVIQFDDGIED